MIEIIKRYNEEYKFSDIHLKEDKPAMLRINGDMITLANILFHPQNLESSLMSHSAKVKKLGSMRFVMLI